MAGGDWSGQSAAAAERRDQVVRLREEDGLTFREIGERLGFDTSRAWQLYQDALRRRPVLAASADRDRARKEEQLNRIDMQREKALEILRHSTRTIVTNSGKVIEDVADDSSVLAAMAQLGRLDDQEAKLLGLYARQEIAHEVHVNYEIFDGGT